MPRYGKRHIVIDIVLTRAQRIDIAVVCALAAVDLDLMIFLSCKRNPRIDGVERRICHLPILRRQHGRGRIRRFPAYGTRCRPCGKRYAVITERPHAPVERVNGTVPCERQMQPCRIDVVLRLTHPYRAVRQFLGELHGIAHRRRIGLPAQKYGGYVRLLRLRFLRFLRLLGGRCLRMLALYRGRAPPPLSPAPCDAVDFFQPPPRSQP